MSEVLRIEVTACDPNVVNAIAKKVIELTGIDKKIESSISENLFGKTYTINEVAKIVSKSPQTIRRHIKEGLLVAEKTGKSWTVTKINLENYVNGN